MVFLVYFKLSKNKLRKNFYICIRCMIFKHIRCYHSKPAFAWEQLQHYWRFIVRLFNVISRTHVWVCLYYPSVDLQLVYSAAPTIWACCVFRLRRRLQGLVEAMLRWKKLLLYLGSQLVCLQGKFKDICFMIKKKVLYFSMVYNVW